MDWNYLSIPKLQRCNRWSLGMDNKFHLTFYQTCNYLSMLGLKLNHVSKRGPDDFYLKHEDITSIRQIQIASSVNNFDAIYQWVNEKYNCIKTSCRSCITQKLFCDTDNHVLCKIKSFSQKIHYWRHTYIESALVKSWSDTRGWNNVGMFEAMQN